MMVIDDPIDGHAPPTVIASSGKPSTSGTKTSSSAVASATGGDATSTASDKVKDIPTGPRVKTPGSSSKVRLSRC